VAQARLAAAAHQLPDDVGRQLLTVREQGTTLQAVISEHAEAAARADPAPWAFWQATADGAEFRRRAPTARYS
jgi:hypothetical protein